MAEALDHGDASALAEAGMLPDQQAQGIDPLAAANWSEDLGETEEIGEPTPPGHCLQPEPCECRVCQQSSQGFLRTLVYISPPRGCPDAICPGIFPSLKDFEGAREMFLGLLGTHREITENLITIQHGRTSEQVSFSRLLM